MQLLGVNHLFAQDFDPCKNVNYFRFQTQFLYFNLLDPYSKTLIIKHIARINAVIL